jgi:heat-inducible transcriptional repressor
MTQRQATILSAIVELYAKTAEPVGSGALAANFDMSSATIRAVMANLEEEGYIMQPHISAGRVPTDKGYRAYVNALNEVHAEDSQKLAIKADGRISQAIAKRIKSAGEVERTVKQAAESLSEVTGNVGLATVGEGLFFTGLATLFGQPEFFGGRGAYEVARLLDNLDEWLSEAAPEGRISVFIGHENPIGKSSNASLIIARFKSPLSDRSYVGILGPTRQNYHRVIGLVDYTGRLLEESLA